MNKIIAALVSFFVMASGAFAQQPSLRQLPDSAEQVKLSFAPLVKETAPAVVNVYSRRTVQTQSHPFANDPFFRQFFGDRFGPQERQQNSLGSGVIVRSDGIIVTNNHVVQAADELRIVLSDRREFNAELIAADEASDLAILRIDTKGERLPVLRIRENQDVLVGDMVLAIGNPFGVGQTVTSGIVSATARTGVGTTDFASFIQTDAAINPGNSGGALIDMDGNLIGVNTAIFSRSGGSNGIGFAIPSDLVKRVIDSALSEGRIVRPWLGARTQGVTADMATALGLDRPRGTIVSQIHPRGPAYQAGLDEDDIILAIDGNEVNDDSGLRYRLATYKPGDTLTLDVLRGGEETRIRVTANAPDEDPDRDLRQLAGANPFAGATVANLSPALADELDLDPYLEGVGIIRIGRGSVAARIRLKPGDVILSVNNDIVESTRQLEALLGEAEGQLDWPISIERNGRVINTTITF